MESSRNNLVYVCSPYKGFVKRNKEYARYLTKVAIDNGFVPITVHLYITEVTDENNPLERRKGMAAGMEILKQCKYILIGEKYGTSSSMTEEIYEARRTGITILYERDGKVYLKDSDLHQLIEAQKPDTTNQEEKAMKHENVVIFDKLGNPSIMVKFTPEAGKEIDPVFIINGEAVKAIYISKYPNTMINVLPCSLPFMEPVQGMNFDEASMACRNKGEGWHLMTNTEWEYLHSEWLEAGTEPHGNTDCGKYYKDRSEVGKMYDNYHTLPGSGPMTWSHTHEADGVFDLCGNFWEWVAGLRLKKGAIQYIENNDAAAADLSRDSKAWKTVEVNGAAVNLSAENGGIAVTTEEPEEDWNGCHFKDMEIRLEEVPEILCKLGIIPENQKEEMAGIWADSSEQETVPIRGSSFNNTSNGGPSAVYLNNPRSFANGNFSFRSAFYEKN